MATIDFDWTGPLAQDPRLRVLLSAANQAARRADAAHVAAERAALEASEAHRAVLDHAHKLMLRAEGRGPPALILGWSVAHNAVGDETGVFHLVLDVEGNPTATLACGSKVHTSGQVEKPLPQGAHACTRCARYALARGA